MGIQEFVTKTMNLAFQAELGDQATKTLIFRGLHLRDQDRMMLANSIKSEAELKLETVEQYLERITRLLRRKEVRRNEEMKSNRLKKESIHKFI